MRVQEYIDKHVLLRHPSPDKMRTVECQTAYNIHKNTCLETNITVGDYIKHNFFNDPNVKHCFTENKFPYSFDDHSLHYLLWFNPLYSNEYSPGRAKRRVLNSVNNAINEIINNDDNNVDTFILFENQLCGRTILDVRHFHIIFYNE